MPKYTTFVEDDSIKAKMDYSKMKVKVYQELCEV